MKMRIVPFCILALMLISVSAWSVTTYSYELLPSFNDYSVPIASDDLIQGMMGTIEAGGFYNDLPHLNSSQLTDGVLGDNVDSVLKDYAVPSLKMSYTFAPTVLQEIRSFGGNTNKDGRVFQNLDVEVLVEGNWFEILHEATTGPYSVKNGGQWEASLIRIFEDRGPLVEGVPISGVRLTYWSPDNTQDWFVPRDSVNAVSASIIKEIDIVPVPEPSSLAALASGLAGLAGFSIRRRKSN